MYAINLDLIYYHGAHATGPIYPKLSSCSVGYEDVVWDAPAQQSSGIFVASSFSLLHRL